MSAEICPNCGLRQFRQLPNSVAFQCNSCKYKEDIPYWNQPDDKMILQECQDCDYQVYVCEGVEPFKVCPECDSPNMKGIE